MTIIIKLVINGFHLFDLFAKCPIQMEADLMITCFIKTVLFIFN